DQVGHRVGHAVRGGDLVHRPAQVAADGGGRVEQYDTVRSGQERRLVDAVGDVVQVPLDAPDVVALLVEGRAERGPGDRRVVVAGCWGCHGISLESRGTYPGGRASFRVGPTLAARQVRGGHRIPVIQAS